jgi:thioredoxin 1
VDFTATWCGPCKALAPIVDKIADEFAGKVKVGKLDIDANPEITAKYGVRSVPTVIVFKGGQKVAANAGLTTREKLVALLGV